MHSFSFPRKHRVAIAAFVGFGSFCSAFAQTTFTPLGIGTGRWIDVTDNGSMAIALGYAPSGFGNFLWTQATGTVNFSDQLPVHIPTRVAISGDGSTITGTDGATNRAFRYTTSDGVVDLGTLPGRQWSSSNGISRDGQTIVGAGSNPISNTYLFEEAFRWTQAGGMTGLGTLGGAGSSASDVSANGSVVVGRSLDLANSTRAFRWTSESGMISLGNLGRGSYAEGVSVDGTVVVGFFLLPDFSGDTEAFKWTESTGMVGLGQLADESTFAFGTSADGSVIIGGGGRSGGFIWTPESGIRDFLSVLNNDYGLASQTTNWDWVEPLAITPDGRYIAGVGARGSWVLDRGLNPPVITDPPVFAPVPETSTFGAAISVLLLGVAGWRWKKRPR